MRHPKKLLAVLVASTLSLTGMTSFAAPATSTGADADTGREQMAAERIGSGRDGRGDRVRSTDTSGQRTRQERRIAGDSSDRTADESARPDRAYRDRAARANRVDSMQSRTGERREINERPAVRTHYANRGEPRGFATRERRFVGQDRYTRSDWHGRDGVKARSHGRGEHSDRYDRWGSARTDRGRMKQRGFENRVDRRLSNQRARIRDGWKSGELNKAEFRRLRSDQKKIARMDRRFGSDGRYTKNERRRLNKALDRSSKRVRRAKTNDRVAYRSGSHERRR